MLRTLKLIIAGIIMLAVVLVAVANRGLVTLQLLPAPLADVMGMDYSVTLPLFIVLLAAVVVGLLLGYLFEYLREHKHRKEVGTKRRELNRLENEVAKLRKKSGEEEDEILTLLN